MRAHTCTRETQPASSNIDAKGSTRQCQSVTSWSLSWVHGVGGWGASAGWLGCGGVVFAWGSFICFSHRLLLFLWPYSFYEAQLFAWWPSFSFFLVDVLVFFWDRLFALLLFFYGCALFMELDFLLWPPSFFVSFLRLVTCPVWCAVPTVKVCTHISSALRMLSTITAFPHQSREPSTTCLFTIVTLFKWIGFIPIPSWIPALGAVISCAPIIECSSELVEVQGPSMAQFGVQ